MEIFRIYNENFQKLKIQFHKYLSSFELLKMIFISEKIPENNSLFVTLIWLTTIPHHFEKFYQGGPSNFIFFTESSPRKTHIAKISAFHFFVDILKVGKKSRFF